MRRDRVLDTEEQLGDTGPVQPGNLSAKVDVISSSVLCVDLDGTLLKTDSLHECLAVAVRSKPALLLRVPFWLLKGRYHLKRMVTSSAVGGLNLDGMPLNPAVQDLVRTARRAGKRVELVSAADHGLIGDSPLLNGLFDAVTGSSDGTNLKAEAKADLLRKRHPGGFAYVGNSASDLPVWRAARERFGISVSKRVREQARKENLDIVELDGGGPAVPGALLRAMRPHQWLKNLLVFVPFFLSLQESSQAGSLAGFALAFVFLSVLTSGTYLINDLLDLESDRRHPRKRARPIASGDLPLRIAAVASGILIVAALAGGLLLGAGFFVALLGYLGLTLAYSFRLKQLPIIDVLTVAALFTLRILAGMTLQNGHYSPWLLMFSIFFFVSLALMKREVELNLLAESGARVAHGRGYSADDRNFVVSFGVSTGVASLVVFSLYISVAAEQPTSQYTSPGLLWAVMAIIGYWLARMWLLTSRGQMNDDPILYAARDGVSLALGALLLVVAVASQLFDI